MLEQALALTDDDTAAAPQAGAAQPQSAWMRHALRLQLLEPGQELPLDTRLPVFRGANASTHEPVSGGSARAPCVLGGV